MEDRNEKKSIMPKYIVVHLVFYIAMIVLSLVILSVVAVMEGWIEI